MHIIESPGVVVQYLLFYSLKHSVMEPRDYDCAEVTPPPNTTLSHPTGYPLMERISRDGCFWCTLAASSAISSDEK